MRLSSCKHADGVDARRPAMRDSCSQAMRVTPSRVHSGWCTSAQLSRASRIERSVEPGEPVALELDAGRQPDNRRQLPLRAKHAEVAFGGLRVVAAGADRGRRRFDLPDRRRADGRGNRRRSTPYRNCRSCLTNDAPICASHSGGGGARAAGGGTRAEDRERNNAGRDRIASHQARRGATAMIHDPPRHSQRSASAGSVRAARLAGSRHATTAIGSSTSGAAAKATSVERRRRRTARSASAG